MKNPKPGVLFPLFCIAVFSTLSLGASEKPDSLTLSDDGAWCWFQDPRAVHIEGNHSRTYAGWITRSGQLEVGYYDHDTGETKTTVIKQDWDPDDHNTCSFLVLPDNRIMLFYARHCKTGLFTRVASEPESISKWDPEVMITDSPNVTYSHPFYLEKEDRYYVFWRHDTWKPTFSTSADGIHWSEPQMLVQEPGREAHDIRPYTKYYSNGVDTIDIVFTDGHPRKEPTNSVYFLRYHEGEFQHADGTTVGTIDSLPIAISESDTVYDATQTGHRAWVWDIVTDTRGQPRILYTRHPSEKQHLYYLAKWNGDTWQNHFIVDSGGWFCQTPPGEEEPEPHYSGGMGFDHQDPNRIFLSREIDGTFEIEKWRWHEETESWQIRAITHDSEQPNVRPVVPRRYRGDADLVLWMHGPYRHYYDGFETAILMQKSDLKKN